MQVFQILTRNTQITEIRPYNPFAPQIIDQINQSPIEHHAQIIMNVLRLSNIHGKLEILSINNTLAINAQHNVVIYNLTLG